MMNLKPAVVLLMILGVAISGCGKSSEPGVPVAAEILEVELRLIDASGLGASIGSVEISDSGDGLVVKPDLSGLPSGSHGYHVHQNPDCGASEKDGNLTAGNAAGEHYDPSGTGKHAGPEGMGHKGDLPMLVVSAGGKATAAVIASRLRVSDLMNRSLIIHGDMDDYADYPGGARIACGVVR